MTPFAVGTGGGEFRDALDAARRDEDLLRDQLREARSLVVQLQRELERAYEALSRFRAPPFASEQVIFDPDR